MAKPCFDDGGSEIMKRTEAINGAVANPDKMSNMQVAADAK